MSLKAQQMQAYLLKHHPDIDFVCPQLPVLPSQMWQVVKDIFEQHQDKQIAIMGSSLGGFLATKAAQHYAAKAVLVNPAVTPDVLLKQHQGPQNHPYLHQSYQIDEHYIGQIHHLYIENILYPENLWVLLQQQDEVLNYKEAIRKYKACKITCEEGGDHSFIGFERYLADIVNFLF